MEFLNGEKLAAVLGKSSWWVTQAKKAGMPFYCKIITLPEALKWMRDNPNFVANEQVSTTANNGLGRPCRINRINTRHRAKQ